MPARPLREVPQRRLDGRVAPVTPGDELERAAVLDGVPQTDVLAGRVLRKRF